MTHFMPSADAVWLNLAKAVFFVSCSHPHEGINMRA